MNQWVSAKPLFKCKEYRQAIAALLLSSRPRPHPWRARDRLVYHAPTRDPQSMINGFPMRAIHQHAVLRVDEVGATARKQHLSLYEIRVDFGAARMARAAMPERTQYANFDVVHLPSDYVIEADLRIAAGTVAPTSTVAIARTVIRPSLNAV
jgi:hypothetical protein